MQGDIVLNIFPVQPTKLKNAASEIAAQDKGNGIIVSQSRHEVSKQMSPLMFLLTNKMPAINEVEAYSTPNMITYSCAFHDSIIVFSDDDDDIIFIDIVSNGIAYTNYNAIVRRCSRKESV